MISITECTTAKQKQQFEDVAEALHKADPAFVPPFPGSVAKYFSAKSAFLKRHGEMTAFIAWRDGKPVGRIAAIINRSHNKYFNDQTGFFGFFECEKNQETANALFAKAIEVLKSKGLTSIRGPYNPSINDEMGLLVFGFEKPPYIGLTWNPSYYQTLVEGAGLADVRTFLGLDLPMHKLPIPERLVKIAKRMEGRSDMKLRTINLAKLEDDLKIVHEVYNATLERNWGFFPIEMEDLLFAADDMRAIADPNLILIAEKNGERAGVALTLPNIYELMILTKNTPRWLRPVHFLWLLKTRRMTTVRQLVYGVSPRFRDRGLHGWLLLEQYMVAKKAYPNAALGWIEENNKEILDNSYFLGATHDRTWKIFEKSLA